MLTRIAILILVIGLPLFALLPEPAPEHTGIRLNASVVDQIRFDDASIVFLAAVLEARMASDVDLPSDVSVLLQCANNELSIVEVHG